MTFSKVLFGERAVAKPDIPLLSNSRKLQFITYKLQFITYKLQFITYKLQFITFDPLRPLMVRGLANSLSEFS